MAYTAEQLSRHPYFADLLRNRPVTELLDPLTGLVARPHILGFVRYLLERETPLTFAMVDLDNFKTINDTYGHHAGDEILSGVAEELIGHLGEMGVAGRFGGDEFLMVDLSHRTYADKKIYLESMYTDEPRVFRKKYQLGACEPYVTATIGCATYPDDAGDYEALFALIDKTLYRGKSKGRNCYIIYVEEKHRNIEIKKIAVHGLFTTLHEIAMRLDTAMDLEEKLQQGFFAVRQELRVSDLFYIGPRGVLRSVGHPENAVSLPGIDAFMTDDLYCANDFSEILERCPSLHAFLTGMEADSVMISRVDRDHVRYGYLMVTTERNNLRIWQEVDRGTLYFLARELAAFLEASEETLDREA